MSNFWWRRTCRKCRTRPTPKPGQGQGPDQAQGKRARDSHSNSFSRYHKKQQVSPRHSRSRGRASHGVGQLHRVLVAMGLSKYIAAFIEEGWTDIAGWQSLDDDTLRRDLGFKAGDVERFNRLKVRYIASVAACSPIATPKGRERVRGRERLGVARAEELSVRFLRFSRDMASASMDRLVYSISPLCFEGGLDRVHAKIYDFCFNCIPYHVIPSAVHNYFGDALCGHLTRPLDDDHFDDALCDGDDVSTAQFERRFVLDGGRAFILRVMTDYHVQKKRRGYGAGRGGKYTYCAKFALALYADRADKAAVEGSTEDMDMAEQMRDTETDTKETGATAATVTAAATARTSTAGALEVTPTAYTYTRKSRSRSKHDRDSRKEKLGKKRTSTGQRHYSCNLVFT